MKCRVNGRQKKEEAVKYTEISTKSLYIVPTHGYLEMVAISYLPNSMFPAVFNYQSHTK